MKNIDGVLIREDKITKAKIHKVKVGKTEQEIVIMGNVEVEINGATKLEEEEVEIEKSKKIKNFLKKKNIPWDKN